VGRRRNSFELSTNFTLSEATDSTVSAVIDSSVSCVNNSTSCATYATIVENI